MRGQCKAPRCAAMVLRKRYVGAAHLTYLVVMRSWEPGHLLLMSVPTVAVAWMSVGCYAPPTGGGAAVGPSRRCDRSAGCVVQPTLGAAHHPEVFGVLAVVHSPAVVLAVLQGLFSPIATNVVHPYGACGGRTDGEAASGRLCHYARQHFTGFHGLERVARSQNPTARLLPAH